jgi:hypothetical protein
MTWNDAADRYPDGQGGVHIVRFAAGRLVAGRLPRWLGVVLMLTGLALPDDGVAVIKGALKWPPRKSWLSLHIRANTLAPLEFGEGGFLGGRWLGPAGERAAIVRAVREWVEKQ